VIELGIIPRDDLRKWSPFFIPLIHDACRKGMPDLTPEEIVDRLYDDPSFAGVLISCNNVASAFMALEAGEDNLHITIMGGRLPPGWVDTVLEQFEKLTSCTGRSRITFGGRFGWKRKLSGKFSSCVVDGVPMYERKIS
jgi:hypothetical protein